MIDSAKLAAVKAATERVREGIDANSRGEPALDMGAAFRLLCDALDALVDAIEPTTASTRCEAIAPEGGRRCMKRAGHPGWHFADAPNGSVEWPEKRR